MANSLPLFHHVRFADDDEPADGAGDGAANQQQVVLCVDLDHLLIADGLRDITVLAGHPLAFDNAARERASAGAAQCTVTLLHTVSGPLSGEIVSTDGTRETATLASRRHVDGLHILQ